MSVTAQKEPNVAVESVSHVLEAVVGHCPDQVRAALDALAPANAVWLDDPIAKRLPINEFTTTALRVWCNSIQGDAAALLEAYATFNTDLTDAGNNAAHADESYLNYVIMTRTNNLDYDNVPADDAGLNVVATRCALWSLPIDRSIMQMTVGEPARAAAFLTRIAAARKVSPTNKNQSAVEQIAHQVIAADATQTHDVVAALIKIGKAASGALTSTLTPRTTRVIDTGTTEPSPFHTGLADAVIAHGTLTSDAWQATVSAGLPAAVKVLAAVRAGHLKIGKRIDVVESEHRPSYELANAALWAATRTTGGFATMAPNSAFNQLTRQGAFRIALLAGVTDDMADELVDELANIPLGTDGRPPRIDESFGVLLAAVPDALFAKFALDVLEDVELINACATRSAACIEALCDEVATRDTDTQIRFATSTFFTSANDHVEAVIAGRFDAVAASGSTVGSAILSPRSSQVPLYVARYITTRLGTSRAAWQLYVGLSDDMEASMSLAEYIDACIELAERS